MPSKVAYIIMPVGSDNEFQAKKSIMEQSLRREQWIARFPSTPALRERVTGNQSADFMLPEIIAEMSSAGLVVADLSLERPSCYYELGVAQAIGCPTFLVAAIGTQIHQVADRQQVHFFADLEELSTLMDTAFRWQRLSCWRRVNGSWSWSRQGAWPEHGLGDHSECAPVH